MNKRNINANAALIINSQSIVHWSQGDTMIYNLGTSRIVNINGENIMLVNHASREIRVNFRGLVSGPIASRLNAIFEALGIPERIRATKKGYYTSNQGFRLYPNIVREYKF